MADRNRARDLLLNNVDAWSNAAEAFKELEAEVKRTIEERGQLLERLHQSERQITELRLVVSEYQEMWSDKDEEIQDFRKQVEVLTNEVSLYHSKYGVLQPESDNSKDTEPLPGDTSKLYLARQKLKFGHLQKGARLRVIKVAESYSYGWTAGWNPKMGTVFSEVRWTGSMDQFGLECSDGFYYPYFSLEEVVEESPVYAEVPVVEEPQSKPVEIDWPEGAIALGKDKDGMWMFSPSNKEWQVTKYLGPDPFPAGLDWKKCYIINLKLLSK